MDDSLRVTTNPSCDGRLAPIQLKSDVPERWRKTPIESLILAHNFDEPIESQAQPKLIVATCIEYRFVPKIPSSFAYVIRRASGRLIGSEFSLAYVLAKGVKHMALVGHNDCGMTKVLEHKDAMIGALVEQGWHPERATEYINQQAGRYMIADEIDTLKQEYLRLKRLFSKMEIAPLFISLANGKLYIPNWYLQLLMTGEVDKSVNNEASSVRDDELLTLL